MCNFIQKLKFCAWAKWSFWLVKCVSEQGQQQTPQPPPLAFCTTAAREGWPPPQAHAEASPFPLSSTETSIFTFKKRFPSPLQQWGLTTFQTSSYLLWTLFLDFHLSHYMKTWILWPLSKVFMTRKFSSVTRLIPIMLESRFITLGLDVKYSGQTYTETFLRLSLKGLMNGLWTLVRRHDPLPSFL